MKFDPNQHLHLGYYENNVDVEAVAYKLEHTNQWVVFLDHEQGTTVVKRILDQYDLHEKYGYKIFTVEADELSYDVGSKLLEEWLKANNIRRVDYPIKSKGYRKKSTFPVECE